MTKGQGMRLLRQMLIVAAAASCAAPVAATRLIALDSRDCFIQDGSCIVTRQDDVAAAAAAQVSSYPEDNGGVLPAGNRAAATPPNTHRAQSAASDATRSAPPGTHMGRLPGAAIWILLATGFCLIGFSLRGSRDELLGHP